MKRLNSTAPHCPVLYSPISFQYVSQKKRGMLCFHASTLFNLISVVVLRASFYKMLGSANYSTYSPYGKHYNMQAFCIPADIRDPTDNSHKPYVFPACGHVFGYHNSLSGKGCPLCRKAGPYVPVLFSYEESCRINSSEAPDHVFNPCGHVADRKVCVCSYCMILHDDKCYIDVSVLDQCADSSDEQREELSTGH